MLATKASLSVRVDALADVDNKSGPQAPSIGIEHRAKLESRLRALEHRADLNPGRNGVGASSSSFAVKKQPKFELNGATAKTYNTAADSISMAPVEAALEAVMDVKEERRKRKEEKRKEKEEKKAKKVAAVEAQAEAADMDVDEDDEAAKKEKKRLRREKKKAEEAAIAAAATTNGNGVAAGKKRRAEDDEEESPKKSKKKKSKAE